MCFISFLLFIFVCLFNQDWSKEAWNGGCPVNVMVPGAMTNYGDCLREPFLR